jgi:hypothetical protein
MQAENVAETNDKWVPMAEIARILGRSRHAAARVIAAGAIRALTLPGLKPRYSKLDTERLRAEI